MATTDDPLMARAKALKLYGLLAHWEEVAGEPWIEPLIQWEEQERARRSLERRLGNAHLGRFRPLVDFNWDWPKRCDRDAIEELMGLSFMQEAANAILVGPNGVGKKSAKSRIVGSRDCTVTRHGRCPKSMSSSIKLLMHTLERLRALGDVQVVEQRFVHDGNIWSSAGVSAGIDLMLAFIASIAGETVAGKVQFQTEYYPASTMYDGFENQSQAPAYIKSL